MNASCRTCEWVISHIWMRHVAHIHASCRAYEYECDVAHMNPVLAAHTLPRACIIVGCMSKQASCMYSEYETSHTIIKQHAHTHPQMHTRICTNRFGAEIYILTTHIFLCTHTHTHTNTHTHMHVYSGGGRNRQFRLAPRPNAKQTTGHCSHSQMTPDKNKWLPEHIQVRDDPIQIRDVRIYQIAQKRLSVSIHTRRPCHVCILVLIKVLVYFMYCTKIKTIFLVKKNPPFGKMSSQIQHLEFSSNLNRHTSTVSCGWWSSPMCPCIAYNVWR